MKVSLLYKSICGALGVAIFSGYGLNAFAQEKSNESATMEEVVITGSRITRPGVESSSPITSISKEEIGYLQETEVEKILRILPGTIPGDGQNVNNGSAGAATVNLRGLGPQRNLILVNGKRATPFDINGVVDTSTIPTALLERIDIVTGGASAVYGSDAIAGAVNFILKRDFEGVAFSTGRSQTGDSDGHINDLSLTFGSNLADDKGNIAMSFGWTKRDEVLLGQRPLGLLGIGTADASNLDAFLAGEAPAAPSDPGCTGPNVVEAGGSTTAIPTRFQIVGGGTGLQFRDDRSLQDDCSVFNFNPFNFYQTPMERFSASAFGHYTVNDHAEVYGSINFTNTSVLQQIAPSGTFGASFDLPISNPLISDGARQTIIDTANQELAAGLLIGTPGDASQNWTDVNGNGVVDAEDRLNVQLRRRTVELGARSERFDSDFFQINTGVRGDLVSDWEYDFSFQYGESNRTTIRDGYTNLTNIQSALDAVVNDAGEIVCANGDPTCVPIDLFGGFGTITEDQAGFATAIALQQRTYEQTVATLNFNGPVNAIQLPSAEEPLLLSVGLEKRKESGDLTPDACLQLAPATCQGGAGGNLLPVEGSFSVDEVFFEGLLPLVSGFGGRDQPLNLEFGYRLADYDVIPGTNDTWKLGLNFRPIDSVLMRVMQQQATRAPNIGELFSPITGGLENATLDPCSVANAGNIDADLEALCISTGMSAAQVGVVQDIVSGQVNGFFGSDLDTPPATETADTTTIGVVWTPDFDSLSNFTVSLDYYDISVDDIIGEFSAQEVLDGCYLLGNESECAKINRVGGSLAVDSAGIDLFTTNLVNETSEGIELGFSLGFALPLGNLSITGNVNKYISQEGQSALTTPVLDCNGFYGSSCDPVSDLRWNQRTTWSIDEFSLSLQWRHIDSVRVEPGEAENFDPAFRSIGNYDYFDLFASYTWDEKVEFSFGIDNLFDRDPPIVGNEAGSTAFNSGNTFPSNYDTLGQIYSFRVAGEF